jgi:hypothetical protein|tara:strand:+ start:396 stop:830 length:435 start_codon:yes stop_codon:yes gene_type:complete
METKSNKPEDIASGASGQEGKNTKPLPIKDINDAESTSQIHYDGNSTFYALNEYEFKTIKNGVDNYWKELCIGSWSIFLPLLLNTISEGKLLKWEESSWELFFNGAFTLVTLLLAVVFSFTWYMSKNEVDRVIKEVEAKPKFKL